MGGWFLGNARWFAGTAGVVRLRWFRSTGYYEVALEPTATGPCPPPPPKPPLRVVFECVVASATWGW